MVRVALSVVLPLLLPTALYFLYAWHVTRRAEAAGAEARTIDVPWSWLVAAGVVLALVSLSINFVYTGGGTGARYEPAHLENGKLVPGKLRE